MFHAGAVEYSLDFVLQLLTEGFEVFVLLEVFDPPVSAGLIALLPSTAASVP